MAAQIESLAGLQSGQLSLKDFEWEEHLRPSSSPSQASCPTTIPEIDLRALYEEHPVAAAPDYANLVGAVCHAASSVGFFQVVNHGISLSALEALHSYARRFFALPFERKYEAAKLFLAPSAGPSGYLGGSPADTPNKWWAEAVRVASSDKQLVLSLAQCICSEEPDQQAFRCTSFLPQIHQFTLALPKQVLLQGMGSTAPMKGMPYGAVNLGN